MKIIAYYTDNGSYAEEAELFVASLERTGMKHHVEGFPDAGGWYANTARKPRFIRDCRRRFRGPLLYVDVDVFVHEDCTEAFERLAREGFDFGAHYFRGPAKGHDRGDVRPEGWRLLSGTLFLGDTDRARALLVAWTGLNDELHRHGIEAGGGQKNLWYLTTCLAGLRVARLSGRYCYVFDKAWAYPDTEPCVIEHTIASRDHRSGTERRTAPRATRIAALWRSIETGRAAPHPKGGAQERVLAAAAEDADRRRKKAGAALSDAKRRYRNAVNEAKLAREALSAETERMET